MTRRRAIPTLVLPAAALLVALLGALMVGPAAATTSTEGPGVLIYEGTRVAVVLTPAGVEAERDTTERTGTLSCVDGECTLEGIRPAINDIDIVFVDGRASYSFPATGTACDDPDTRAEDIELEATATALTGTILVHPQGPDPCGNTTVQRTGTTYTFELALVSGEPCHLDDSCPEPTPTADATADPIATPGGADGAVDAASPSILSTLQPVAAAAAPRNLLWAALGTLVLVLLVALPTALFDSAIDTALTRFGRWWRRRRAGARRGGRAPAASGSASRSNAQSAATTDDVAPLRARGFGAAAGGVAMAAVISAFVDPAIGLNAMSLRTVLSLLVGFALTIVVGWLLLVAVVRRRHPGTSVGFEFAPLTLLVVIGGVLFSRLTGFEPGIVFGLVAGVVFGTIVATADTARLALTRFAYSFAVALLAWVAYSALSAAGSSDPISVFVRETLSALTIAGIVAMPIALLPIRGLTGHELWRWKRWVWAVAYGIGVFGFLLVLMPLPSAWDRVGLDLWTWVGLYAGYAIAAGVTWLLVERPWVRAKATSGAP